MTTRAIRLTIEVPDVYQEEGIHPHLIVESLNIHPAFVIVDIEDTDSTFSKDVTIFKLDNNHTLIQEVAGTNIQDSL